MPFKCCSDAMVVVVFERFFFQFYGNHKLIPFKRECLINCSAHAVDLVLGFRAAMGNALTIFQELGTL